MNNEEKELLLKDICGRLPYGVKYQDRIEGGIHILSLGTIHHYERFIPYLCPMSSMTEEERTEYFLLKHRDNDRDDNIILADEASAIIDWLNAHHLDYRGLIEKGLALEAPKDMYNTKIE